MTIVPLNIPDELREAFDKAFPGQEPSAVLLRLLREEIARREQVPAGGLTDEILAFRARVPPVAAQDVQAAREAVRT